MGCGGPALRLQDPFSCSSFSLDGSVSPSQLFPDVHQGNHVERWSDRLDCEGNCRTCSFDSGLLQPAVCYPQSHRGLAPGHRSLVSQPLGSCLSFSHGDGSVGASVSSSGRLDGVPGSPGCVPPGSGAPVISALPEVLRGGFGAPVPHALFQSVNHFSRVHAGHGPYFFCHAPIRFPNFALSGRLARPRILVSGHSAGEGLLWFCRELGVRVNLAKSSLDPSQTLDYLGMRLQTLPLRVFLILKRVQKLSSLLHEFVSCQQQPLTLWRQLLGVMSFLSTIVPGSLQLRLNASGRRLPDSASVSWDESCPEDLRWWSVESHLLVGLPLGLPHPDLALYTDASDAGWGAFLADDQLSGLWPLEFLSFSINHRELLAVLYSVQGFLPVFRGRSMSLFADNTTALSYLRKQGETHSSTLNAVAQTILRLCEDHRIRLVPQFIPGHLNVLADSLSRRSQVLDSEWTLCHQLLCLWPANIDLFATSLNARFPVYFTQVADPQSVSTDAMMQSWDGLQAYAFPPFGLLHRVLSKAQQSRGLELTLVAPFWPQHPWFPDLLELLVAVPVFLPQQRDLLRQPHFHRFLQNLRVLRLTAYSISSDPPEPSGSLRQWLINLPAADEPPPV